jgi:hypothetical protein
VRLAVYATFLADACMALAALAAAGHLHPRTATRLLTATAVVVGGSWSAALTALAIGPFGGLVVAAHLDRWPRSLGMPSPVPHSIEAIAVVALFLTALSGALAIRRQTRAALEGRRLQRDCADTELIVVDTPRPIAFALPGRPGRIVVSPAMLRALDADDRRGLLAHERAHLRLHHRCYQAIVDLGAALSPVLIPMRAKVRYSLERWADEEAADQLGERRLIARALARAGLATAACPAPSLGFGTTGVTARIEALLERPPPSPHWPLLWPAALGAGAIMLVAEAMLDLERLLELAVRLSH